VQNVLNAIMKRIPIGLILVFILVLPFLMRKINLAEVTTLRQ
jgi:hypothetical protein